ncbi:MAG: Fe-S cluster assembly ATPase SufC [Chloroflexota bacterium]|nr:Fe-S cluster assembly ATPase SufC [Chloroflexota bacterium]MDE2969868.1 Fe-S cluster assembly ATPase SufC [Chloroflexota bacterium]
MLEIRNLTASIGGNRVLNGVNLTVERGEVHAIMGPNGSGKSTLSNVLAGHPQYIVESGEAVLDGEDLLALPAEERARAGVFLCFQHPVEVPGVRLDQFLRAGYNAIHKSKGLEELDPLQFDRLLQGKAGIVNMEPSMLKRSVNDGFSGGEKKRNEILQMAMLEPRLSILDEPDSGLDVDSLRLVADGINQLRSPDRSVILITHYQRILNLVVPDVVNVLMGGRIVRTGGVELAEEIETEGYEGQDEVLQAQG